MLLIDISLLIADDLAMEEVSLIREIIEIGGWFTLLWTTVGASVVAAVGWLMREYISKGIQRDLIRARAELEKENSQSLERLRQELMLVRDELAAKKLSLHQRQIEGARALLGAYTDAWFPALEVLGKIRFLLDQAKVSSAGSPDSATISLGMESRMEMFQNLQRLRKGLSSILVRSDEFSVDFEPEEVAPILGAMSWLQDFDSLALDVLQKPDPIVINQLKESAEKLFLTLENASAMKADQIKIFREIAKDTGSASEERRDIQERAFQILMKRTGS